MTLLEKTTALIGLGNLSSIAEQIAPEPGTKYSFANPQPVMTVKYHRDLGVWMAPARHYADIDA